MARVMRSIASSWPKIRSRSLPGRSRSDWRPPLETAATGRPLMLATTAATSLAVITWRRAGAGPAAPAAPAAVPSPAASAGTPGAAAAPFPAAPARSFQRDPASSITSIALSGRRRSWTWTAASSAASRSARSL